MSGKRGNRIVTVFGADTRLGRAVATALEASDHQTLLFARDGMGSNPVLFVHERLSDRKPHVVINCLVDPDSGLPPATDRVLRDLVAPTHAMVQQSMAVGARYIHLSSSRVFGQSMAGSLKRPYYCYDPAVPSEYDAWAGVLSTIERTVLMHTAACSPTRWKYGRDSSSFILLRLPHVLHPMQLDVRPNAVMTLEMAIRAAMTRSDRSTFAVPSQHTSLGLLPSSAIAKAVMDAAESDIPSGIYQVSSKPVTLQEIFNQVMLQSGRPLSLVPQHAAQEHNCPVIYGVHHDSAMSPQKWQRAGLEIDASWRDAISEMLRVVRRSMSSRGSHIQFA